MSLNPVRNQVIMICLLNEYNKCFKAFEGSPVTENAEASDRDPLPSLPFYLKKRFTLVKYPRAVRIL